MEFAPLVLEPLVEKLESFVAADFVDTLEEAVDGAIGEVQFVVVCFDLVEGAF